MIESFFVVGVLRGVTGVVNLESLRPDGLARRATAPSNG